MAGDLVKTDCPAWGSLHQAVIKTDKNNRPYIYCAECGSQFITRNERQADGLRARFADSTVTVPSVTVPSVTVEGNRSVADLVADIRATGATTSSRGHDDTEKKPSPPPQKRSVWAPLIGS